MECQASRQHLRRVHGHNRIRTGKTETSRQRKGRWGRTENERKQLVFSLSFVRSVPFFRNSLEPEECAEPENGGG
jgi:hypothetical protein